MKPVFNFIFCYCKATCFLSLWRLHSSLNVESKSVSLKSLFWFSDTRFLQDVAGRCAQQPALQSTVKHQNRKHKQESFISEHNKQRAHTLIFKHVSHVSVWVLMTCSSDFHKLKHTRWSFLFFWSQKESNLLLQEQITKPQHTLKHIQRNMWHKTNEWTFQWAGARTISTISWDNISTIYYGFLFLFCCFWFVSIYTSWIVRLLVPSLLSEMPL